MMRRLLGFALVAVICGAPVATAVCQATCAATDAAHNEHTATHHSCHGESPSGTALTAALHLCGHIDEFPAGRDQARRELTAPVIAIPTVLSPAVVQIASAPVIGLDSGPPSFVARSSPLRL